MPKLISDKPRHCDDILADPETPKCVRDFLEIARAPAVEQIGKHYPPLFATLTHDITIRGYLGYWEGDSPKMRERQLPAETRVRIVMASRFGDVGITDNLDAEYGYSARLALIELKDFSADA